MALFAQIIENLPGAHWLPERIARIRASVYVKLLVAFLGIVILMVVLAAVGLRALENADNRAAHLVEVERQIAAYRRLQHNATRQLYSISSAILSQDERTLDVISRRLLHIANDLERAEFVVSEDQREFLENTKVSYNALIEAGEETIELVRQGKRDQALELHNTRSTILADNLLRDTYALINVAEADMLEAAGSSKQAYLTSRRIVFFVSAISIILALVVGYSISSSLIRPMADIATRLRRISKGEFSENLSVANRDELGGLAENVNRMSVQLDRLYGELETANRHKSMFLANMSHELRTPMNSIIGFNRIVMRRCKDILPDQQYENLQKIAVSADHLLALINTVLDLSKIEAGRVELQLADFELPPLIEGCTRTVTPLLDEDRVVLSTEMPSKLPVLYGDQDKVRQILLNLLSNAAKFTDEGSIKVSVDCRDGVISISVTDTGIGLPPDQIDKIFEEFAQLDSTTTRRHAGTGLGLAISKRLTELLGGDLVAQSEPGEGSVFTLTLPIRYQQPKTTDPEFQENGELSDEEAVS